LLKLVSSPIMKCTFSISCSKAEKEIDLLQDEGKIKKGNNIDHHVRELYSEHLPPFGSNLGLSKFRRLLVYIGYIFVEFSYTETSGVKN
jgi:hypothetical protein